MQETHQTFVDSDLNPKQLKFKKKLVKKVEKKDLKFELKLAKQKQKEEEKKKKESTKKQSIKKDTIVSNKNKVSNTVDGKVLSLDNDSIKNLQDGIANINSNKTNSFKTDLDKKTNSTQNKNLSLDALSEILNISSKVDLLEKKITRLNELENNNFNLLKQEQIRINELTLSQQNNIGSAPSITFSQGKKRYVDVSTKMQNLEGKDLFNYIENLDNDTKAEIVKLLTNSQISGLKKEIKDTIEDNIVISDSDIPKLNSTELWDFWISLSLAERKKKMSFLTRIQIDELKKMSNAKKEVYKKVESKPKETQVKNIKKLRDKELYVYWSLLSKEEKKANLNKLSSKQKKQIKKFAKKDVKSKIIKKDISKLKGQELFKFWKSLTKEEKKQYISNLTSLQKKEIKVMSENDKNINIKSNILDISKFSGQELLNFWLDLTKEEKKETVTKLSKNQKLEIKELSSKQEVAKKQDNKETNKDISKLSGQELLNFWLDLTKEEKKETVTKLSKNQKLEIKELSSKQEVTKKQDNKKVKIKKLRGQELFNYWDSLTKEQKKKNISKLNKNQKEDIKKYSKEIKIPSSLEDDQDNKVSSSKDTYSVSDLKGKDLLIFWEKLSKAERKETLPKLSSKQVIDLKELAKAKKEGKLDEYIRLKDTIETERINSRLSTSENKTQNTVNKSFNIKKLNGTDLFNFWETLSKEERKATLKELDSSQIIELKKIAKLKKEGKLDKKRKFDDVNDLSSLFGKDLFDFWEKLSKEEREKNLPLLSEVQISQLRKKSKVNQKIEVLAKKPELFEVKLNPDKTATINGQTLPIRTLVGPDLLKFWASLSKNQKESLFSLISSSQKKYIYKFKKDDLNYANQISKYQNLSNQNKKAYLDNLDKKTAEVVKTHTDIDPVRHVNSAPTDQDLDSQAILEKREFTDAVLSNERFKKIIKTKGYIKNLSDKNLMEIFAIANPEQRKKIIKLSSKKQFKYLRDNKEKIKVVKNQMAKRTNNSKQGGISDDKFKILLRDKERLYSLDNQKLLKIFNSLNNAQKNAFLQYISSHQRSFIENSFEDKEINEISNHIKETTAENFIQKDEGKFVKSFNNITQNELKKSTNITVKPFTLSNENDTVDYVFNEEDLNKAIDSEILESSQAKNRERASKLSYRRMKKIQRKNKRDAFFGLYKRKLKKQKKNIEEKPYDMFANNVPESQRQKRIMANIDNQLLLKVNENLNPKYIKRYDIKDKKDLSLLKGKDLIEFWNKQTRSEREKWYHLLNQKQKKYIYNYKKIVKNQNSILELKNSKTKIKSREKETVQLAERKKTSKKVYIPENEKSLVALLDKKTKKKKSNAVDQEQIIQNSYNFDRKVTGNKNPDFIEWDNLSNDALISRWNSVSEAVRVKAVNQLTQLQLNFLINNIEDIKYNKELILKDLEIKTIEPKKTFFEKLKEKAIEKKEKATEANKIILEAAKNFVKEESKLEALKNIIKTREEIEDQWLKDDAAKSHNSNLARRSKVNTTDTYPIDEVDYKELFGRDKNKISAIEESRKRTEEESDRATRSIFKNPVRKNPVDLSQIEVIGINDLRKTKTEEENSNTFYYTMVEGSFVDARIDPLKDGLLFKKQLSDEVVKARKTAEVINEEVLQKDHFNRKSKNKVKYKVRGKVKDNEQKDNEQKDIEQKDNEQKDNEQRFNEPEKTMADQRAENRLLGLIKRRTVKIVSQENPNDSLQIDSQENSN